MDLPVPQLLTPELREKAIKKEIVLTSQLGINALLQRLNSKRAERSGTARTLGEKALEGGYVDLRENSDYLDTRNTLHYVLPREERELRNLFLKSRVIIPSARGILCIGVTFQAEIRFIGEDSFEKVIWRLGSDPDHCYLLDSNLAGVKHVNYAAGIGLFLWGKQVTPGLQIQNPFGEIKKINILDTPYDENLVNSLLQR